MGHLTLNMQDASIQSEALLELSPYSWSYNPEEYYVCSITPSNGTGEPGRKQTYLARLVDGLKKEIEELNFPGSIDIRLIQQNSSWLAIFASTQKVVSAYMRIKAEDVQKLLAAGQGN